MKAVMFGALLLAGCSASEPAPQKIVDPYDAAPPVIVDPYDQPAPAPAAGDTVIDAVRQEGAATRAAIADGERRGQYAREDQARSEAIDRAAEQRRESADY